MSSCRKVSPRSRCTPLSGAALAISLGTKVSQASAVQQERELGQSLAMYVQLQEGLTSLALYSLVRGCSGDFAGHQSVSGLCSTARTGAGAVTSYVCPVAGRSHLARVVLPCPGLLWRFRWAPKCLRPLQYSKNGSW